MSLDRYYKWWFQDYNPLDGRLRFLVYFMLLYWATKSLLPVAVGRLEACPESYFAAAGLMQFLIPAGVSSLELASFLFYSQYAFIFFWICAAVGLFGRISGIITGAGALLFWGAMQSCAGTGHDWHLPMYTLIFMGLFSKNDKWSADYLLSTYFRKYPFRDFSPNKYGSLARKLVLVTTVFILFAGGIAKLFTGGFAWLTGESLYIYLREFNEPSSVIGPWLLDFFLENKWIVTFLAIWTVILELGSLLILFNKNWRLFYVINLWAFHIGIYLLMFPRYFPSMVCYLLIVNWRYTYNLLHQRVGKHIPNMDWYRLFSLFIVDNKQTVKQPQPAEATRRLLFPSAILLIFLVTIFFRIETFPLTYVPMYSTVLTEEKIGEYERADFHDREALHRVAEKYTRGEQPWYVMFYYPRNIEIRLWHRKNPDSEIEVKDVTDEYKFLIQNWPKYHQVVTEITLADISNNLLFPQNSAQNSAETEDMLREIKSILSNRGGYEHIEKIALVYHFNEEKEEVMIELE